MTVLVNGGNVADVDLIPTTEPLYLVADVYGRTTSVMLLPPQDPSRKHLERGAEGAGGLFLRR